MEQCIAELVKVYDTFDKKKVLLKGFLQREDIIN